MYRKLETAVVIPCYNEEKMITQTIKKLPKYIDHIIAVNDASTDDTIGVLNKLKKQNNRLIVVDNETNQGVGGALIAGYNYAIEHTKATAIGIVAGDDQFDSSYLEAKYRQFGNIFISLLTKFSTGYYSITDITNGCGWLRRDIIEKVDFSIVEKRYDYETSMLTALSIVNAKVIDHAVPAHYGDEKSTIKLIPTAWRNLRAVWKGFWRRIYYKYVLYGFHPVALFLFTGMFFFIISLLIAGFLLCVKLFAHQSPTAGSVMLAVLPFVLSVQLVLTALTIDVSNESNNFKK